MGAFFSLVANRAVGPERRKYRRSLDMKNAFLMMAVCAALTLGSGIVRAQSKPDPKPAEVPAHAPEAKDEKAKTQPKDGAKPDGAKPDGAKPGETTPAKDGKAPEAKQPPTRAVADPAVLDFKVKDIEGKEVDLGTFKGKVVLIVNVASKCGYTRQYAGLQKLYEQKKDQGLVILGFPANDFGSQEPGTDAEIKEFCTANYKVTFPMFSKISVKGESAHPLYKKLSAQPAPVGGEPKWNFTKFLVDRAGNAVARYDSNVKPDSAEFVKKIDELLAQK
jgi:glutathione peroxidase